MQGQKSNSDSVPDNFDVDMGSFSFNNDLNQHSTLNNSSHLEGSRFPINMGSSSEATLVNAVGHGVEDFTRWSLGHPSSILHQESQASHEDRKGKQLCTPSMSGEAGSSSAGRQFELPNVFLPGMQISNQIPAGPVVFRNSSPNADPWRANPSERYVGHTAGSGASASASPNNSRSLEVDDMISDISSSANFGSLSNSSGQMEERNNGSSSSMGYWGSSCKRIAFEGTSGHPHAGSSSGYYPQTEGAPWPPTGLSLSQPTSWNSPSAHYQEPPYPRTGIGMREGNPAPFSYSRVTGNSEIPPRNFSGQVSAGPQQESDPSRSARRANVFSLQQSHRSRRPNPLDPRLAFMVGTNTYTPQTELNMRPPSGPSRNMDAVPWNATSASRSSNVPSSFLPGEGFVQEGVNFRSNSRSISDVSMFPLTEARTLQDPAGWSSAGRNTSGPNGPPAVLFDASSSVRSSPPSRVPIQPPVPYGERLLELAPWSLSPPVDGESSRRSSPLPPLPSNASSLQEIAVSAGANNQGIHPESTRSSSADRRLEGVHESWRALTANVEGRQRVVSEILQVLEAMQRGERVRAEDYMIFQPFLNNGFGEMHDRHRDMRLDVDNMSYEELLALEERIGDVSTGLSEETILKGLKRQKKNVSVAGELPQDVEPCCICQEEYADGDDLGVLGCGHEFHADCIKEWLMRKNLCPICKTTGLPI
ncbi:E3 ubiquitin-protein ligase MBR2-like isoform X1 [Syzygium oleosum]|uniref:E3 ubiquitin-protein ligase MBR2-like isoform X1 n=1 Tax=Syzygium oleosum TaxID=219896 RepID=UPI0011D253B5|nr:E3 ubiquitin-protein ligase MBR2-like isoform X1 [Syzygium oleosum]XP_030450809.1 E3 ubiquitin-protein ligase MBR2-like isoform X1 [Syzygium oleosum]XP_056160764.1 E3 ubiquitin-protein ligase MBR2-like isoform X1 [Syzygium oleosum]XP_056160765.1 E3 ubiquitin-protein ligase MBR2-like isoform X1 [Syzygium oleosum]XP_056160767.1 E3 ubiquitin-protein ligase MBR2-like isoform X1 [Syzygium oleosum]